MKTAKTFKKLMEMKKIVKFIMKNLNCIIN